MGLGKSSRTFFLKPILDFDFDSQKSGKMRLFLVILQLCGNVSILVDIWWNEDNKTTQKKPLQNKWYVRNEKEIGYSISSSKGATK